MGIAGGGSANNADTGVLIPGKGDVSEAGVPISLPGEAHGVVVGAVVGSSPSLDSSYRSSSNNPSECWALRMGREGGLACT